MNDPGIKERGELPLVVRAHLLEGDISEAVYRFWCRITGHKFERRKKERPNSCVLVTKSGFHLISKLLSRGTDITPRQLEVYQMNCSEKVPFGAGQTAYYHRFLKPNTCPSCGRCYEVGDGDKKIVGKF